VIAAEPADEAFCRESLALVSRTFALSISALPAELGASIRTAYLLCRTVDTIEDDPALSSEARQQLFDAFDRMLSDAGDGEEFEALARSFDLGSTLAEKSLCREVGRVLRQHRLAPVREQALVRACVLEMSAGLRHFRLDMEQRPLRDVAELEAYCHAAAGTVGGLLTALFEGWGPPLPPSTAPQLRARAEAFALTLQMVNILADVAEDYAHGRCFLPLSLAEQHRLDLGDVLAEGQRDSALAVVGALCRHARAQAQQAREYTLLWPAETHADIRSFCALPLLLALATLAEIESGRDTVLRGRRPRIPRERVAQAIEQTAAALHSDSALRALFQQWAGVEEGAEWRFD
jgi:farnesyl-diphosphate farnesyltransferase